MVDRVEVYEVADRLRGLRGKEAVRVSVRRVRENLKRRGSFGDVGDELRHWKAARNYQPVIELMQLPDAVQKRLGDFGKALLDEVRASESRVRDAERANFEIERAAHREILDEAGMTIDMLEAQVAALTAEVERLRAGGATEVVEKPAEDEGEIRRQRELSGPRAVLEALMSRRRDEDVLPGAQEAFWRAVEAEVFALLRKRGPMPSGGLLLGLSPDLLSRGKDVEMPLSAGWLGYRLRAMIEAGKPLVERDGRFEPVEGPRKPPLAVEAMEAEVPAPPPSLGDSVMWEIRRLLVERGPMRPAEIRKILPARIQEAAKRHWKGGLDRLAKDMSERAGRGYYFTRLGDGRYAALETARPHEGDSEEVA